MSESLALPNSQLQTSSKNHKLSDRKQEEDLQRRGAGKVELMHEEQNKENDDGLQTRSLMRETR